MDKYCEHCYLRDAKPCMECSMCNPGHRNFRPAPTPPPTNADRIRSMSDEELADFIFLSPEMEFEICRYCTNGNPTPTDDRGQCLRDGGRCYANDACDAFKNWLRQPSEE